MSDDKDKELLELSAKASGITVRIYDGMVVERGTDCVCVDRRGFKWNPLTDDGDALRLAVKLGIYVGTRTAEVWRYDKKIAHIFEDGGDEYQATRRAIVRAAAEIGKHSAPSDSGREKP